MTAPSAVDPKLNAGRIGWLMLSALGVSYVIAGDYAAWNFGLAKSGWGGMTVSLALVSLLYLGLLFCMAELASAIPADGGAVAFAQRALGRTAAFTAGLCVVVEYVAISGAIGIFLSSYFSTLTGLQGPWIPIVFYGVFVGLHLWGVGEALGVLLLMTGIAVLGLIFFLTQAAPHVSPSQWVRGSNGIPSGFLPFGLQGVWSALPFAIAFFLAVEGVPLASGEAKNPTRTIPQAMLTAWGVLMIGAVCVLFVATGVEGAGPLAASDSPLVTVMRAPAVHSSPWLSFLVNLAGFIALAAALFSVMFAYSRQIFALAELGFLPRVLVRVNRRQSPWVALVLPSAVALGLTLVAPGEVLIVVSVVGATISYLLVLVAFATLRQREPELHRPYRAPGGLITAFGVGVLTLLVLISGVVNAPMWSGIAMAAVVVAVALEHWFSIGSRRERGPVA